MHASKEGHADIVELLVDAGADIQLQDKVIWAACNVGYLVSDGLRPPTYCFDGTIVPSNRMVKRRSCAHRAGVNRT
jgi:hypothetical protein